MQFDNVLCEGQDIELPSGQVGRYQSLYLLTTSDSSSPFSNNISGELWSYISILSSAREELRFGNLVVYADGTSVSGATLIPPWQSVSLFTQNISPVNIQNLMIVLGYHSGLFRKTTRDYK